MRAGRGEGWRSRGRRRGEGLSVPGSSPSPPAPGPEPRPQAISRGVHGSRSCDLESQAPRLFLQPVLKKLRGNVVESRERSPHEDLDTSVPSSFVCNGPTWKHPRCSSAAAGTGRGTPACPAVGGATAMGQRAGETRRREGRQRRLVCVIPCVTPWEL